jgi:hypothetical protein
MGTKSLLFGAHQVLLHPWFVAAAWLKLYGRSRVVLCFDGGCRDCAYRTTSIYDVRLWLAFVVHDWGYWGLPNMDGPEGEQHPLWAARLFGRLFGVEWERFVACHSRYVAKQQGHRFSALCVADKLATPMTPRWLYLPLVRLTGEIREYMSKSAHRNETGGKYAGHGISLDNIYRWHADMSAYMRRWVEAHRTGSDDTWTRAADNRPPQVTT